MAEPGRQICILHNHPGTRRDEVASAAVSPGDIVTLYRPGRVEIHAFNSREETTSAVLPAWCALAKNRAEFAMLQRQVGVWSVEVKRRLEYIVGEAIRRRLLHQGSDIDKWNKLPARVMEYAGMAELRGFGEDPEPEGTATVYEQVATEVAEIAELHSEVLVDARALHARSSLEKVSLVPSGLDRTWSFGLSRLAPVVVWGIASGLGALVRLVPGRLRGRDSCCG